MSNRKSEFYILDILITIDKINRYTAFFNNADELLHDELAWDATIRELEIIGEATKVLLKNSILNNKNYRRIVDFRNQINHGYFGIDEEIVWDVIKNKLLEYENDLITITQNNKTEILNTINIFKDEMKKQEKVFSFLNKLEECYKG